MSIKLARAVKDVLQPYLDAGTLRLSKKGGNVIITRADGLHRPVPKKTGDPRGCDNLATQVRKFMALATHPHAKVPLDHRVAA